MIEQKFSLINLNTTHQLGLFCFVGINEFGEEIVEFLEPDVKLDLFYYSCSNKFVTEIVSKYIGSDVTGTIIFANGGECLGYQFKQGQFIKIFGLNGNLIKRHNKGGYSANRFARIAEESRHLYVVRICDRIRELSLEPDNSDSDSKSNQIWIFGSDEIVQMVISQSPIKLLNGGFLNFNSSTISNSKYWIEFLTKSNQKSYDNQYKEIIEYLATNPDMLDFDPTNKDKMKYFIEKIKPIYNKDYDLRKELKQNQIPLEHTSKYYSQLMLFDYIGVKYYNHQINEPDDIHYIE